MMVGLERFKRLTGVVLQGHKSNFLMACLYLTHLFLIFLPLHVMPSNAFMLSSLELLWDDHMP